MSNNELFITVLEARIRELTADARSLVEAVEGYVELKPGQEYIHRTRLLAVKNELKTKLK